LREMDALRGRRVLVTGHTGFTGTWACYWLHELGAEVHGIALEPETDPNLFQATALRERLAGHLIGDISDYAVVARCFKDARPDLVLHLAAQPLVRRSYSEPVRTFSTNLMGTVHVLEAARQSSVRGVVCITTDKVYENREWIYPYREIDRIGGKDPYSASKASAELAIRSYRESLGSWQQELVIVAARGGNIIGGGDWSQDRLVPDFARAAVLGAPLTVRHPNATRPWQHVLCLVHGYLLLLAGVLTRPKLVSDAWNFGPSPDECVPVRRVVELLQEVWAPVKVHDQQSFEAEARVLAVDSSKARHELGWQPVWGLCRAISATALWYRHFYARPADAAALVLKQIRDYADELHR